jgi:hypothetical protein
MMYVCLFPAVEKYTANIIGKVFLNIVLDDAVEEKDGGEKVRLGMVVSDFIFMSC